MPLKQEGNRNDDELKYPQQLPPTTQQSQYTLQQQQQQQQLPQQLHQPLQQPLTFPFQHLQQPFQRQLQPQSQPQSQPPPQPQPQFQQSLYFQRHQPMLPSLLSQQQPQQSGITPQDQPQLLNDASIIPILKSSDEIQDNTSLPELQSVLMRKSKSGTDGANNDKVCPFCRKQFTHKGSFLRHLETRKGDSWHPVEECYIVRNQHARRKSIEVSTIGYNGSVSSLESSPMGKSTSRKRKPSKRSLARSQMSSDLASGQKEKSKLRRKLRDRRIKAKIITNEWLINQFTKKSMPDPRQINSPATFCHFVAFYTPIKNWPSLASEVPNSSLCDEVLSQLQKMEQQDLTNLFIQSMQVFGQLDITDKKRLWLEEVQNCLNASISNFTLFDLNNIKTIMDKREQHIFEGICADDNLTEFVDVEENPTLEEEEGEEREEEEEVDTPSMGASTQSSQQYQHVQTQPQQPPFSYNQQRHHSPSQLHQPPPGSIPLQQQQHLALRSNSLPHNTFLPHLPNISNNDYNDFNSSHFF